MAEYKLVICGGGGVGKSAITVMFIQGQFLKYYDPTIEDSYKKQVTVDDEICFLDILDTAGQEEFSALRDGYMRNGQGFMLVYTITERNSLHELEKFRNQILRVKDRDDVPMILFGNKCDLESERQVEKNAASELAAQWGNVTHFEGSAKTNTNIEQSFYELVRIVRKDMEKQQPVATRPSKISKRKNCIIL